MFNIAYKFFYTKLNANKKFEFFSTGYSNIFCLLIIANLYDFKYKIDIIRKEYLKINMLICLQY